MIDYEDREWERRFGESYLDTVVDETDLDEESINRLEREFEADAANPDSTRSTYGHLDEIDNPANDAAVGGR